MWFTKQFTFHTCHTICFQLRLNDIKVNNTPKFLTDQLTVYDHAIVTTGCDTEDELLILQISSVSSPKTLPQDHLDPQTLANNWGIGIETAKWMIKLQCNAEYALCYTQHYPAIFAQTIDS